jgi:hypothetical protein
MQKVKLKLKRLHWQLLADDVKAVMPIAPARGWELQTMIIADLYLSKMKMFEVEPYGSDEIKISLTQVQAYAINQFLGSFSKNYNIYLRMMIEPKLLPGK